MTFWKNSDAIIQNAAAASPAVILFFFIVAYKPVDILSCELRHILKKNMYLKHIVGIILLFVFVVGDNTTFDFQMKVTVTMLIYIWFIFVMRSPLYITIFSLLCIFSVYMIHIYQKTESKTSKKKLDKYKKRFLITSIVSSTFGFFYFIIKTQRMFGKNWSFLQFWLGWSEKKCFK